MKCVIRFATALTLAGSLSSVCHAQVDGQPGHSAGEAVRRACHDDIAKLCSETPDGHGAFRCLRDHQDTLSDTCKSALSNARAQHHGHSGWNGAGSPQS